MALGYCGDALLFTWIFVKHESQVVLSALVCAGAARRFGISSRTILVRFYYGDTITVTRYYLPTLSRSLGGFFYQTACVYYTAE